MKPPWEEDFEPDDGILPLIPGKQVHATAKALLWRTEDGEEHWIPKSQIVAVEEAGLRLTNWLTYEKGLDKYDVS